MTSPRLSEVERLSAENARLRAQVDALSEPAKGSFVAVACFCGVGAEQPPYETPRCEDTGRKWVYEDGAWMCPVCADEYAENAWAGPTDKEKP